MSLTFSFTIGSLFLTIHLRTSTLQSREFSPFFPKETREYNSISRFYRTQKKITKTQADQRAVAVTCLKSVQLRSISLEPIHERTREICYTIFLKPVTILQILKRKKTLFSDGINPILRRQKTEFFSG